MKFIAVWTDFNDSSVFNGMDGVIISGCEDTLAELRNFGRSLLYYCFEPPAHAGVWKWEGGVQSVYSPSTGETDYDYVGTWTFIAPVPGESVQ